MIERSFRVIQFQCFHKFTKIISYLYFIEMFIGTSPLQSDSKHFLFTIYQYIVTIHPPSFNIINIIVYNVFINSLN